MSAEEPCICSAQGFEATFIPEASRLTGAEGAAAAVLTEVASLQLPMPAKLPACTWQLYSKKGCRAATAALCHTFIRGIAQAHEMQTLGWLRKSLLHDRPTLVVAHR